MEMSGGLIGDRVMVIFDRANAFVEMSIECAISMNSAAKYIINRHFKRGEVACGIGIDAGNMLATKTGVRRRGVDQGSYHNLVWLGRPANIASKLTDLANRPGETLQCPRVVASFYPPRQPGEFFRRPPDWSEMLRKNIEPSEFLRQLSVEVSTGKLVHSNPDFREMYIFRNFSVRRPAGPTRSC